MSPASTEPQEAPNGHDSPSRKPGSKRREYIQQACITCRKKKVKCTGGETCAECIRIGESCIYTERRRKARVVRPKETRRQRRNSTSGEYADHMVDMNARLAELEAHCSQLKTLMSSTAPQHPIELSGEDGHDGDDSPSSSRSVSEDEDADVDVGVVDPQVTLQYETYQLNPLPPLTIQDGPVETERHQPFGHDMVPPPPPLQGTTGNLDADVVGLLQSLHSSEENASANDRSNLSRAWQKLSLNNGAHFRPAFDIFFRFLNPLHPILNENQFRGQFDRLVFGCVGGDYSLDCRQHMALALLVYAEVSMLNGESPNPQELCGWNEFCHAESILADIIWSDSANLLTVQCLLLKTRYLTYLQRLHQARDTMAIVVRISLKIGLHDQSRWMVQGSDPFEIAMRQRVFWCQFTLDRSVSLACGMPPTLRASDCWVDLPPAFDDRSMAPFQSLPGETSELSFIPYLRLLIGWGELWDEIWDSMFSVRALPRDTNEVVTELDAKICTKLEGVPSHLQWKSDAAGDRLGRQYVEPWVIRQRFMYATRMVALRLLIRQEQISKPNFGLPYARELVQISRENVRDVESYLQCIGQNIDRYFTTSYLSAVIIPLGCIITRESFPEDLRHDAVGVWRDALRLLDDLSRSFGLSHLLLRRYDPVVQSVSFITGLRVNIDGQFHGLSGSTIAGVRSTRSRDEGEDNARSSDTNAAGAGEKSMLASFSPMNFQGLASDPDLWRIATW